MDPPADIVETILEWTQEGNTYLYNEQPEAMAAVEGYLRTQEVDVIYLYRRTDRPAIMSAEVGDVIDLDRATSWSWDAETTDDMYEEVESVQLILSDTRVLGLDLMDISAFPEEEEVLLAPCQLVVTRRSGDELYVDYIPYLT
jgi:hypothetical protein